LQLGVDAPTPQKEKSAKKIINPFEKLVRTFAEDTLSAGRGGDA
jgi:hypothetical protein